ncbi:MAG TPA: AAA family ATPase [Gemmatimonadales bacterium]|jgi:hypothetical protein|nr:AAA family ATPase [Gemmatimonadales bacterium]
MDPIRNPFAPGAGTQPPELAGRDDLLEAVRIAIARVRLGLPAKSVLMIGLRGVGKTVLLDRMKDNARATGVRTLRIEAPENRSLPAIIAPQLRQALLGLSLNAHAKDFAHRALRALAGFAKALKVKYADIEVGFDFDPEPGLADNGDLEHDLGALLEVTGVAAQHADTALAMFVDELQYVDEAQLEALITALHLVAQRRLPVVLVGAGLPQLRERMGRAKSYAERLFDFPEVGPLPAEAARDAVVKPLNHLGVDITPAAIERIVAVTRGYPYFIQEWGKYAWDVASSSPIDVTDVIGASVSAVAALDESFFRVRFDRLTNLEKRYLRAMAELGPDAHRSGDVAQLLGRTSQSLGPTRGKLISKGMVWSPGHGDTAFTVPLFDEFMRRAVPGEEWRAN